MRQAIAGVAPPELGEVTIMTVWPSVASTGCGRFLGRLMAIQAGFWIITVGRLVTLSLIGVAPLLYFYVRLPWVLRRYRLTNRRVCIIRGIRPMPEELVGQGFGTRMLMKLGIRSTLERFVDLDRFDTIDIVVRPGQQWYHAGDLLFRRGPLETFRLEGVPRPETFRQTCLKARMSYVGVRKALELQAAGAND